MIPVAFKKLKLVVCATAVNSAFRARWLASSEVNYKYYSPPSSRWDKIARQEFCFRPFFVMLKEIIFLYLCGIYLKNYLPPLPEIIINYY